MNLIKILVYLLIFLILNSFISLVEIIVRLIFKKWGHKNE